MVRRWWKQADSTRRALVLVALGLAGLLAAVAVTLRYHRGWSERQVLRKAAGIDLVEESPSRTAPMVALVEQGALPDKRVRRGSLTLEVRDMEAFETRVHALTSQEGYLSKWHGAQEPDGSLRAQLTWRVPNARFEASLAAFKALGRVVKVEVSTEDVGRAYADLEARRLNKRAAAARIRELIQTRTGKLSEVLEAEQSLTEVTQELEQMEAQKRVMDSEIAFATLQAEVHTPRLAVPDQGLRVWVPLRRAFRKGVDQLVDGVAAVVELSVVFVPWLLLPGLGLWMWRRRRQKAARSTA